MTKKQNKIKNFLVDILEYALIIGITYCVFTFVVKPVRVEGSSMMPTIHDNDYAIVDVLGLSQNGVERFDIVIIESSHVENRLIKRVIGLPGEKLEFKDDQLYINDNLVSQPFLDNAYLNQSKKEMGVDRAVEDFTVTLGPDEYFVMGDNRLHSSDSRNYGPFRMSEFVGKNGFRVYPFSDFNWMNKNK